jgi:hypothetical protein
MPQPGELSPDSANVKQTWFTIRPDLMGEAPEILPEHALEKSGGKRISDLIFNPYATFRQLAPLPSSDD